MKRFILLVAVLAIAFGLTGCGSNMSIGFGNYNFRHVHFTDGVEGKCATVENWHNDDLGIEVKTVECGSLYISEGSYIMIENENKCPYCH